MRLEMNIDELLAAARLAEQQVPVCLRPDLLAAYTDAEAALEAAEKAHKTSGSLDAGEKLAAAAAVEELRDQMLAASVRFTVRALPRRRWSALYAEHPPREADDGDTRVGFNRDTFYDALVRECVVEPQLSDEQWAALDAALSTAQYAALKTAAWLVNNADVDVPFLLAASRAPTSIDPGSGLPDPSGSASSGSTAGSPSRSTRTTKTDGSSRPSRSRSGTPSSKP
jgi:hypothetical protein